jgi:hypothetical protein
MTADSPEEAGITPQTLDPLQVELLSESPRRWRLLHEFRYDSAVARARIIVPAGTVTDFASVPRIMLVFLLVGDYAHAAAVVHDYLYQTGLFDRVTADRVFFEAMLATGVERWRATIMHWGVHEGGQARWATYRVEGR